MFFSYVVVIIVVVSSDARGSVQIYVLCDKKMNTKEQQHTSQHLVKAKILQNALSGKRKEGTQFDFI